MSLGEVEYTYFYEQAVEGSSDEVAAATARRNVARSLENDPARVGMGPTASELHQRAVRMTAGRNGRVERDPQ